MYSEKATEINMLGKQGSDATELEWRGNQVGGKMGIKIEGVRVALCELIE